MRLLIPAVIALLLAAIATELYVRLYSGHELALLATIAVAVYVGALAAPRAVANVLGGSTGGPTAAAAVSARAPAAAPKAQAAERRESGRVKWFNRTKGFGFIVRDDGVEIFVHHRNIEGAGRQSLREGQRVSFVVVSGQKGPQAEHVAPIDA